MFDTMWPKEVEIPARFAGSGRFERWFLDGYSDAVQHRPMPFGENQRDLVRYEGKDAWEAYRQGYVAGRKQLWGTR